MARRPITSSKQYCADMDPGRLTALRTSMDAMSTSELVDDRKTTVSMLGIQFDPDQRGPHPAVLDIFHVATVVLDERFA